MRWWLKKYLSQKLNLWRSNVQELKMSKTYIIAYKRFTVRTSGNDLIQHEQE